MATVQDIFYNARALIDDYNDDGVIIAPDDVASLETNGMRFVNMGLGEIYAKSRNYETFKITRKPVPNLLGSATYFNILEFIGEDASYQALGAKAYYFEVDNDAIVYVEEYIGSVWTLLSTIDTTGTTELTAFKGLITPSDSANMIRLRFSGTTFYRYKNIAMFSYPFKLADIPDYRAWVKYTLPTNVGDIKKVVTEYPTRQYSNDSNFKLEGFNDLYINYFYDGEIRIIYSPIPETLTDATDIIPINNPIALQFLNYYVAAKIALTEAPDIANFLEQKSNELKFESIKGQPSSEVKITDMYFGG